MRRIGSPWMVRPPIMRPWPGPEKRISLSEANCASLPMVKLPSNPGGSMKIHAAALLLIFATACASSKSSTPSSASAATPPSSSEIIRDVEDASATLKKTLTSLEIVVEGRSDVLKARDAYFTDLADLDRKIETVRDHAADLARRRDA